MIERNPALSALLLNREAAAKALSIGERTLWNLTKSGEIPCVHIGRRVLYDPLDFPAFIKARKESGQ